MLRCAQQGDKELTHIEYCWTDTWCINQNDPEDKSQQIPHMEHIYRNACCVVVTVRHKFSFSQNDWNELVERLQNIISCIRDPSTRYSQAGFEMYQLANQSPELIKAINILREFNSLGWMGRVWTAQEYILAKRLSCVGDDLRPFNLLPKDMESILLVWGLSNGGEVHMFTNLFILIGGRLGSMDMTLSMELPAHRKSTYLEDEIYGLMGASGVVIAPMTNAKIEEIWGTWWEKAIQEGHLIWALLPRYLQMTADDCNCVMPSFKGRLQSLSQNQISRTPPLGPVEVQDGTVKFSGFLAGTCTIVKAFGRIKNNTVLMLRELIEFSNGDLGLARQLCAAFTSGTHNREDSDSVAEWECAFYHWRLKTNLPNASEDIYQNTEDSPGELKGLLVNYISEGNVFLALVQNSFKTTPILVSSDEQTPEGQLLAIDLNAKAAEGKESRMLMIVSVPSAENTDNRSLHRFGISSELLIMEDQDVGKAEQINGHVYDTQIETFEVGGKTCWYCSRKSS
jgi:hypothetical protein